MKRSKYADEQVPGSPQEVGPFDKRKHAPIKVSFGVYVISLVVVVLVIFILMLVQYFPGHKKNHKLEGAIHNADVTVTILIPDSELSKRKDNPINNEYVKDIEKLFRDMGAKSAEVDIKPK